MILEILVPHLPESVADATLMTWNKKIGDQVTQDEVLIELETDKVILEVPALQSGIITEIFKHDGDLVLDGDKLALLDTNATVTAAKDSTTSISDTTTDNTDSDEHLSPAVRRLISEHKLDPKKITGSGKQGRLTKTDVLNFLNQASTITTAGNPETTNPPKKATETASGNDSITTNLRAEQRVPMTRLRAKVAERLLQAQQNAAMLTTFNEVNMQSIIDIRKQYKDRFEKKHSVKLGFMSFFVKAAIEALKKFPAINASIDEQDIIYHGYYDMGIAVTTPRGLVVPVIKDADQLDFAGIEKNINEFGTKARTGSLSYEDLTGGTFTITNGGIFGSMLSTPILNPPQCAILGMHAIKERPVVENGVVVIQPIMYLALSYDHRLVDGQEAVQFLVMIKESLESPAHLLLNI